MVKAQYRRIAWAALVLGGAAGCAVYDPSLLDALGMREGGVEDASNHDEPADASGTGAMPACGDGVVDPGEKCGA